MAIRSFMLQCTNYVLPLTTLNHFADGITFSTWRMSLWMKIREICTTQALMMQPLWQGVARHKCLRDCDSKRDYQYWYGDIPKTPTLYTWSCVYYSLFLCPFLVRVWVGYTYTLSGGAGICLLIFGSVALEVTCQIPYRDSSVLERCLYFTMTQFSVLPHNLLIGSLNDLLYRLGPRLRQRNRKGSRQIVNMEF